MVRCSILQIHLIIHTECGSGFNVIMGQVGGGFYGSGRSHPDDADENFHLNFSPHQKRFPPIFKRLGWHVAYGWVHGYTLDPAALGLWATHSLYFHPACTWSGLLLSTSGHGGHPDAVACAAASLPARPAPHQEGIGCGIRST